MTREEYKQYQELGKELYARAATFASPEFPNLSWAANRIDNIYLSTENDEFWVTWNDEVVREVNTRWEYHYEDHEQEFFREIPAHSFLHIPLEKLQSDWEERKRGWEAMKSERRDLEKKKRDSLREDAERRTYEELKKKYES